MNAKAKQSPEECYMVGAETLGMSFALYGICPIFVRDRNLQQQIHPTTWIMTTPSTSEICETSSTGLMNYS